MAKINIDGEQNVEVSVQIPSEKTPSEQLAIMEAYTKAHQDSAGLDKAEREINCLKTIFPVLFRSIEEDDLLAGRLDFLPIGFGSVTSIGGVGHYCVFHKLRKFKDELTSEEEKQRVDALYEYWQDHDVKAIYCQDVLNDTTTGRFIDCDYPFMATARLSGMMLDYKKLMKYGIPGLIDLISSKPQNAFMQSSIESLKLLKVVIDKQVELVHEAKQDVDAARLADLKLMENDLLYIRDHTPKTFHQALQLFWIYAMVAGVINYGRMDDVLGPYLKRDLDEGRLSEEDAYRYVRSLWKMIENRRTTVNGRIIVGGRGREHVEAADMFTRLCLRVCKDTRYVEPQFTLRIYEETPQDILDMAYDCIGSGATYPTLYNDEVNVPAVEYAMRVDRKTAEQYVPFGCGEFVITAKSVGTPNTLLNLLKIFNITLNDGIDSMDGKRKVPFAVKPLESYVRFDDLYSEYKKVLDYYFDLSIEAQYHSYDVMNKEVSFLFTSILMDDCIERGKALLDGGDQGAGKLAKIDDLIEYIDMAAYGEKPLIGKKVLISAGPTIEKIDPVRYISNHSSGKMGYALARAARNMGANVTLVSGPVNIKKPNAINIIDVSSAEEMAQAIKANYDDSDYVIMAAAVADFTPTHKESEKIKKKDAVNSLELKASEDILKYLGKHKKHQKLCGFAMETTNVLKHAKDKFKQKNCDLLVVNDLNEHGAGFKVDTNRVTLIDKDDVQELTLMSKEQLAYTILNKLI
ncbi:bifunctional phosphopantothenoylcysteine decarboxylase/phosphopantothenate--cysteine ligase CoaBC [Breznakia sp. OttesenSCG-928-G09]|nr:bifunctional phosphopantothenoylcysteine decarboxylase/phosphopantothenate--cysteine ligase CoaBC [Breznakia sp. OttesenSCG-928-G09]